MKKLVKNIMAAVMASSCLISTCALNSNAINEIPYKHFDFSKYTEIKASDLFSWFGENATHGVCYTDGEEFYTKSSHSGQIAITMSPEIGVDLLLDIAVMIRESYDIDNDYIHCMRSDEWSAPIIGDVFAIYIVDPTFDKRIIAEAPKILEDVKKMTDVYYCGLKFPETKFTQIMPLGDDVTDYLYLTDTEAEKILNCVDELNLDVTAEVSDYDGFKEVHLIPNNEITWEEHFEINYKVKERTRISPKAIYFGNDGVRTGFTIGGDDVDITNCLYGDANEDGEVGMADAAAIINHMGNPDEYALSPQGYFNADIDGNGLTGADAIEIQHKVAKAGMPQ